LAESTNKNLTQIIKRTIEGNPRQWHTKLDYALWDDRINIKSNIKTSPYALVYGKRPMLPIHLELSTLKILQELEDYNFEPLQVRFNQLIKMEEDRNKFYQAFQHRQKIVKKWFDKKKSSQVKFEFGDIVLK